MPRTRTRKGIDPLKQWTGSLRGEGYGLNLVVVFEDDLTQSWAEQACNRAIALVGHGCLHKSAWHLDELLLPHVFPDAVEAAARADVIVVSMLPGEEPPVDLCVWIDAWLPRRYLRPGALLSFLGIQDQGDDPFSHIQAYLGAVARKGHLDYFPERRKVVEDDGPYAQMEKLDRVAHAQTQLLTRFLAQPEMSPSPWTLER